MDTTFFLFLVAAAVAVAVYLAVFYARAYIQRLFEQDREQERAWVDALLAEQAKEIEARDAALAAEIEARGTVFTFPDDVDDGRVATCEICGKGIMPGEAYHVGPDADLCEAHAPTYQDMLDNPGNFIEFETERSMTADEAAAACDAHVKAGGSLSDKMVERAGGDA